MTKNELRRLAVKRLAKERNVSLKVAAHIYNCWNSKQQKAARNAAYKVGGQQSITNVE